MTKISAFIITKNEEDRISKAINSVKKIADEIIVVDSGSSDNTVEICKKLGAKTFYNPWPGYVKQKFFAENLCQHNWVLNIDADEELSIELQDEIEYIFSSNLQDSYHAYEINFIIIHRLDKERRTFAPENLFIRLYNSKFYSFENNDGTTTHDLVVFKQNMPPIKSKIYILNEIAYHRSGSSIEQLVNKANFYSSEQAQDLVNLKRNISKLRLIYEIFFAFFKAFIIRRYFIFGFNGFVDSVIFAFARFIRLAKARELQLLQRIKLNNKS